MAELKLPRLLAAAKEFNIGQDTLIDFLIGKGFGKDELKPTSKLTEEMYRSLQQEFQGDKAAKIKSDQLELPKGSQAEAKKKKEEEEISFRKEEKASAKPAKKEEEAKPVEEAPKAKPVKEEEQKAEKEEEVVRVETPEIEGPKVINKIDLSAIDSSTRPKKGAKKKEEEKPEEEKAAAAKPKKAKKEEEPQPVAEVKPDVVKEEPEKVQPPVVENIEIEKLSGPKILGKIELPVTNDTRPVKDEKRKRKRIPIEKKDVKRDVFINKDGDKKPSGGGGFNRDNRGGRGGNRRDTRNTRREDKLIDEKEIQEKIKETQAKLAGGGNRGKNLKAKLRREKRQELADAQGDAADDNKLQLTEFISVSELANLMDVSFAEVISKCMSLGIMVSINQRLDAEVIELVASEFGFDVEFIDMEKQMEMEEDEEEDTDDELRPRSPIVTIMGHVDHGKTSLLDYIRKANVVAGEAGGITQHIGAYKVNLPNGRKIAFLDTPGHEAFTAMRARGSKLADVAIIVVAADDSVMPQTKEAINHAQAAGVPMIFAINKIDKEGANPEKIKEQLAQMNILVEDWGGKFQSQEISAKKGLNIDLLLEKILLEAELLELKANPDRLASGSVIEASLDKGRGYQATILVQNGTLEQGDMIACGQHYGKVKAMFNERGQRVEKAGPSAPVQVLGLNGAPQAGEKFKVYEDENEAKEVANHRMQIMREQGIRARKHLTLDEIGRRLALGNFKELPIIIKGDFDGSVEALSDSLQKLSTEEVAVNVVHKGVGQITESDVLLATASDAIILGFQVRPSMQAARLAEQENIEIRTYSIIYDAIEEIRSAMEGLLEPKVEKKTVANIEIREIYKIGGVGTIAGCYVLDGKMTRNTKLNLVRDGIVIHTGELSSLKRFKDDVKEVSAGYECGLMVKNYNDVRVGDIIEGFDEVEVKRTL